MMAYLKFLKKFIVKSSVIFTKALFMVKQMLDWGFKLQQIPPPAYRMF